MSDEKPVELTDLKARQSAARAFNSRLVPVLGRESGRETGQWLRDLPAALDNVVDLFKRAESLRAQLDPLLDPGFTITDVRDARVDLDNHRRAHEQSFLIEEMIDHLEEVAKPAKNRAPLTIQIAQEDMPWVDEILAKILARDDPETLIDFGWKVRHRLDEIAASVAKSARRPLKMRSIASYMNRQMDTYEALVKVDVPLKTILEKGRTQIADHKYLPRLEQLELYAKPLAAMEGAELAFNNAVATIGYREADVTEFVNGTEGQTIRSQLGIHSEDAHKVLSATLAIESGVELASQRLAEARGIA